MTFTTSQDSIVRKRTAAMFLILIGIPSIELMRNNEKWMWYSGFIVFFLLLIVFSYLNRTYKYELAGTKLFIHRLVGTVEIDLREVTRIDRMHHDLLKHSTKGGGFGYTGKFNTDIGSIQFYATRRDRLVMLIKQDGSRIIVTPDEADAFIDQVESQLNIAY